MSIIVMEPLTFGRDSLSTDGTDPLTVYEYRITGLNY